jgi:hypothetical protein
VVFNMNVGGGQSIFAQSSSRVNELDAELRDKHTGKPAEDIKPLVVTPTGGSRYRGRLVSPTDRLGRHVVGHSRRAR